MIETVSSNLLKKSNVLSSDTLHPHTKQRTTLILHEPEPATKQLQSSNAKLIEYHTIAVSLRFIYIITRLHAAVNIRRHEEGNPKRLGPLVFGHGGALISGCLQTFRLLCFGSMGNTCFILGFLRGSL